MKIEMHYPAKGDLPETSGEMHAQRKPVLAYTKSLGWTQAIRRRVGKKFEWVCSNYDGNTLFFDDEIIAWTELPGLSISDRPQNCLMSRKKNLSGRS